MTLLDAHTHLGRWYHGVGSAVRQRTSRCDDAVQVPDGYFQGAGGEAGLRPRMGRRQRAARQTCCGRGPWCYCGSERAFDGFILPIGMRRGCELKRVPIKQPKACNGQQLDEQAEHGALQKNCRLENINTPT